MPSRLAAAVLALAAGLAAAGPARADDQIAPLDARRDVPITLVGGGLYIVGELPAKHALSPDACRWCADNALDRNVRDALVWDSPANANTASNLSAFIIAPALAAGILEITARHDGHQDHFLHNTIILAEAGVLASDFAYLVKIAVARERPFVHQLAPADKLTTDKPDENNLSFFSGHSTLAMSLAVAAGTTATLRGYRHDKLVWGTLVPVALATGYFRIAADRHWTTDVVTGWFAGAAFGFAVPYFLHRRGPGDVSPTVARTSTSTAVGVAFTW